MGHLLLLFTFAAIFGSNSDISEASSLLTAVTALSRRMDRMESRASTTASSGNPFSLLPSTMQTILEEQEIESKEDLLELEENDIKNIFEKVIHQKKAIALQKQFKEESQTKDNRTGQDSAIEKKQSLVFTPKNRDFFNVGKIERGDVMTILEDMIAKWNHPIRLRADRIGDDWIETGCDSLERLRARCEPKDLARLLRQNIAKIDSDLERGVSEDTCKSAIGRILRFMKDPKSGSFRLTYSTTDDCGKEFRPKRSGAPLYLFEHGSMYITPMNKSISYLLFRLIYKATRTDKDFFDSLETFAGQIIHPEDKKRFLAVLQIFTKNEDEWCMEWKTPISHWGAGVENSFENLCHFADDWSSCDSTISSPLLALTNKSKLL